MNNDKFLNKAIELTEIAEKIEPGEYFRSKLPNPFDDEIMQICTLLMQGTAEERQEFITLIDDGAVSLLRILAHRMTMVSVRKNSPDYLLKGLVALTLAAAKSDYRDILMTVSLFHHSALKLNLDPRSLFSEASQHATSEAARKLIVDFADRSPEEQGIDQMGFKEIDGPSGIIYQFGGHPIADGWL